MTCAYSESRWSDSAAQWTLIAQRDGLLNRLTLPIFVNNFPECANRVCGRLNARDDQPRWEPAWFDRFGAWAPTWSRKTPNTLYRPNVVRLEIWDTLHRLKWSQDLLGHAD